MADGKISKKRAGWGFIELPDDSEIYFTKKELRGLTFEELSKGDAVSFEVGTKEDGKSFAANIQKIKASSVALNQNIVRSPAEQVKKLLVSSLERELSNVKNGLEFEKFTFLVLRLLGIHTLYQYDPKQQAGRADGFFICDRLAVMYDCTLKQDFELVKQDQIENYVNKMRQSSITIDVKTGDKTSLKQTHDIQSKTKQIWILTKNLTRDLHETEGVVVREVSVDDLVSLLQIKLNANNFKESDLVKYLLDLDDLVAN
ncbi:MAG: cold shock domain-containing protein [Sideroxydans sp.]|nr:cold shock domain-containing protein [Sideroxydans sp.]